MRNDFLRIGERQTTMKREILAGFTIFATMAYVLAVQPAAICGFGPEAGITAINGVFISKSALMEMTALISGLVTIFMGLYAWSHGKPRYCVLWLGNGFAAVLLNPVYSDYSFRCS